MSFLLIHLYRLTEDYNLELQYRKPFLDIWREEKDDPVLGPLSERMGVRSRSDGSMLVNEDELEAASMFAILHSVLESLLTRSPRSIPCVLLLQGVAADSRRYLYTV